MRIVAEHRQIQSGSLNFQQFVEGPYFDFYSRKWKASTAENNKQRIRTHLVAAYPDRELRSFKRDELQDLLDSKTGMSFSVVDHLRWDMKQIFDMAMAEGLVERNPALLLFTPREAKRPTRRVLTIRDAQGVFSSLDMRERLIARLALLAGMRPGEIFGLKWGQVSETYAEVRQGVYRGVVDTPKTEQSWRKAAIANGLLLDFIAWRARSVDTSDDAWVFPSERMTPLSKDNCWRRSMLPKLKKAGLAWANFQVMRRTHASLMKELGVDPKVVADQLGHSVDVNQNVYTQTAVDIRRAAVNELETLLVQ